jgi:hypothetical protein
MKLKRKITFVGLVIMVLYPIAATTMWFYGYRFAPVTIMCMALFIAYLNMKDVAKRGY